MNHIKYLLTLALCFCFTALVAQKRISGHVWSKLDGPVIMANVVELDKSNRVVSATQTDASGNFSLTIKNPANTLQVSYIGYTTKKLPLSTTTSFKIELEDNSMLKEAVVSESRRIKSNGLAIPEREISVARQSLDMDEMAGLSFTTAGEALQGQIAGLDIVANSGNLGAGTSMRLRGVTSINGSSEPLIVVDGYILEDYNAEDFDANDMDEQKFANLLRVNPEDIQSIEVLKDASASAIWGARGSNGVIEIKTRRGARGKTKVNFNYQFNLTWQSDGYKMLDGDGYTMMLKEAYFNPKQSDVASGIVEISYLQSHPAYYGNYNKNTDWVKEVTQVGQKHSFGVNVSGGGEKANFRVSGNYDTETGSIIKQKLDRFTTRLALDYFVSDRIKFSSNFSLTYTNNLQNYSGILGGAYNAMPNMAVYRNEYRAGENGENGYYYQTDDYYIMPPASGSTGLVANGSNKSSYYLSDMVNNGNPVATAHRAWSKTSSYDITPQFSIEYKLLGKDDEATQLNYTGEVYLAASTQSNSSFYPHSLTSLTWQDGIDKTSNGESKHLNFTTRHSLLFKPFFYNDKHSFQAMLRGEMGSTEGSSQNLSSTGINGGITDPTVPGYLTSAGSGTSKGHTMAGIATAHYSYGSKYSITGTLRADGMTKFGAGKKWGFFPGVSGRWNVSDEEFFEPLRGVVNMLSLRPGWGITGNAWFGEGVIYNKYAASGSYNGVQAIVPQNLRLTEIRWEKTNSWNLGVDLHLFDGLFKLDLNIYNKKTTDLLNSGVRIPSTTGFSSLENANIGSMENEGWELYVRTRDVFKVGKFAMNFYVNFAQNINTVTEMDANVLATNNPDYTYQNHEVLRRVQVGHALGGIYGFRYKGVYAYDYDHSGYFLDDSKNQYYKADGSKNTAAATGLTAPVARDVNGNVIYDKRGNPLPMYFNYGGVNYQFQGGDVIYEDINHDGNIDELDIVYLGGSNPKINGGFGFNASYGRFRFTANFNYRIGNKIINMARLSQEDMRTNKNQCASVAHRWRKNGDQTLIPRAMNASAGESYNALVSDRYVEDGDFLRLNSVRMSYDFDAKSLKKYGLSKLMLSFSANNLFFITKYSGIDPEHSASGYNPCTDSNTTPRSRYVTFSLNLGF